MELKQYAALLWRWAWLILLAIVLAAGAAYISSRMQTPVYQATTTILIDQAPDGRTTDYTSIYTSERLAITYADLIIKRPVLEEVVARLDLGIEADALKGAIAVSHDQESPVLDVKVQYTDPAIAATIANTLVEVFSEQNAELQASRYAASKESLNTQLQNLEDQIQEKQMAITDVGSPQNEADQTKLEKLQNELSQLEMGYTTLLQTYEGLRVTEARSVSNVVQVEPAIPPRGPFKPNTMMNTLLGGVVGAMLAMGGIFLIEYLDDTVKSTDEAVEILGIPILGFVAKGGNNHDGMPITAREPRGPVAEAFRSLRSNIQFAGVDHPIKTLLITSPGPEEGKSTVSTNLAMVMAYEGKNTLLMDADLRKPQVHRFMGAVNNGGMTYLFAHPYSDPNKAVQHCEYENLDLVTSGKQPPNPAELLGSRRMTEILNKYKKTYDSVIIDSPPIGAVTDPTVLSAKVDAVLLVVEPMTTRMEAARVAIEQLTRAGANVIGMVYNNVPLKPGYYTGYYGGYVHPYHYGYTNGKDGKKPALWKKKREG
jgi:succinoglycan biosynthesis transport protein ExoP